MIRSSHGGLGPRGRPQKPVPRPARADAPRKTKQDASRGRETPESRRGDDDFARLRKTTKTAVPAGVSSASDESREIAMAVAIAAIEKKASGLEVIDVAGRVDYADFLVLMSGRSDRHVTALASAIEESLRKHNKRALAVEGLPHASWVLMDFGDVVVHVFQDDARAAYDIDGLWMDARRVPFPATPQA
jgi:ribosome-associated protein